MVHQPKYTHSHGSDLLVRFGIDSTVGNVVARVLVWLMLFQPVYVAMGMELEEQESIEPVESHEQVEAEPIVGVDPEPEVSVADTLDDAVSEPDEHELTATAVEALSADVDQTLVDEAADDSLDSAADGDEEALPDNDTVRDEEDGAVGEPEAEEEVAEEGSVDEESAAEAGDDPVEDDGVEAGEQTESDDDTVLDDGIADNIDDGVGEEENSEQSSSGGSSGGSSTRSDDEDSDESDADTTTQEAADGAASDEQAATSTSDTVVEDDMATSTEETLIGDEEVTEELNVAQNLTNKYMFGEGDCTLVSDGEFYCVSDDAPRYYEGDARVYVEKDHEGDREVYYFNGVEVKRITNNGYDDFAAVFDEDTMRIVWQAMINDRLQIFVHELPTNTTRQITTSRQNSSNPDILGDTVVWQEWVDTNWEIMMTDVDNNGAEFEIERLTDNVVHDMFPQMYDDLITWQHEKGTSWEVVVYDMRTGKTTTLEKSEDTKYENPRFVLLFDSRHDNGDIETIGYDLDSGEMMELGTRTNKQPVVPVTPADETQDALAREAASSTQIKIGREDNGDDEEPEPEPLVL